MWRYSRVPVGCDTLGGLDFGHFPLASTGTVPLSSFIRWVQEKILWDRSLSLITELFYSSSTLQRKDSWSPQGLCASRTRTPRWRAPCSSEPWPLLLMLMPFLQPGLCGGVCVDNSPCCQPCPPGTQGNMVFLCREKKWYKITDTCRTINAFNIFEVTSFPMQGGVPDQQCILCSIRERESRRQVVGRQPCLYANT